MEIKEIRIKCQELANKAEVELNVPIEINGRLTRTLGRVTSKGNLYIGLTPVKIEFSKNFVQTATIKDIEDVIIHEMAHYVVVKRTKESHGHDAYFKKVCLELGGNKETGKCSKQLEETEGGEAQKYKYSVFCPSCGRTVGHYQRMSGKLKRIDTCLCGYCENKGLQVITNY